MGNGICVLFELIEHYGQITISSIEMKEIHEK